ncbi:MAG TPA: 50S ribosomal protein L3 [Candidatus Paceibacterota bacterium]|jgi:large subunit ribosomal protein L3|nr:50S ribosomal protein L3 [Candidatus Paceibacterota bacterium]
MKYILGTKEEMTQLFDESGKVMPVTVVKALPNTVTGIKTVERDGYTAVQVATGDQKESRVSRAVFNALGKKAYKSVKEFRTDAAVEANIGDTFAVDVFEKGDDVIVTGTSKAKGFQGVVKRHGFHGGPRSHGQKHSEREPGSIGGGLRTHVPKGMRMAGRTGGDTVTVKGLKIVAVDAENNLLYISGAVPGRRGTVISIVG